MSNKKTKLLTFISISFLAMLVVPLSSCAFLKDSVKTYKRSYRFNEIKMMKQNTFKKLNNVSYPNKEAPEKNALFDSESEAYNDFSNQTYHALVNTSKNENFSYSSVGLYSLLNEMVYATSNTNLKNKLESLLGLSEENRERFFKKVMYANLYASEENTTQLKNAAFFNNSFAYNEEYLNRLTKLYCESTNSVFQKM